MLNLPLGARLEHMLDPAPGDLLTSRLYSLTQIPGILTVDERQPEPTSCTRRLESLADAYRAHRQAHRQAHPRAAPTRTDTAARPEQSGAAARPGANELAIAPLDAGDTADARAATGAQPSPIPDDGSHNIATVDFRPLGLGRALYVEGTIQTSADRANNVPRRPFAAYTVCQGDLHVVVSIELTSVMLDPGATRLLHDVVGSLRFPDGPGPSEPAGIVTTDATLSAADLAPGAIPALTPPPTQPQ